MIKTLEDLTAEVTTKFGKDKSDDFIEFLENMTDTINDLSNRNTDVDERLSKLDNDWREKYIKRFTTVDVVTPPRGFEEEKEKEKEEEKTIDDLFND